MRIINKKVSFLITVFCLSMLTGVGFSSCAKKIGCPANEQAHGKKSKKVKGGSSNLFSKKMRKN